MDTERILRTLLAMALLACTLSEVYPQPRQDRPSATKSEPTNHLSRERSAHIWAAAATGNLGVLKQQLAQGRDINARAPEGGLTPLMWAAITGQRRAAELLLKLGADPNLTDNSGSTALHMAAFLGHQELVQILIDYGADATIRNQRGHTPLDAVSGPWTEDLEQFYNAIASRLRIKLDLEKIKAARPKIAALLAKHDKPSGYEPVKPTPYRGSYYMNGQIHVNTYGTPEGKPLTSGHWDFKPSWSKTGNMLVFFRRLKNDPVVTKWITAICIINVDGTGFHQLTDDTHTDFNPTWTRDGSNTPIWNRKNPETGGFIVMAGKVGGRPGEEVALTDKRYHTWAYTCLKDGRILVQCNHPKQGWGYYLMTPGKDGRPPRFERIQCELAKYGLLDRVSVSPSETKVCFEYQRGFRYKDTGRTLYMADFDAKRRTITNAKPFANQEGKPHWYAYPRWTPDEAAIVYHANKTGKGALYLYTLKDGSTRKVSTNVNADYRYPHCEATPK